MLKASELFTPEWAERVKEAIKIFEAQVMIYEGREYNVTRKEEREDGTPKETNT